MEKEAINRDMNIRGSSKYKSIFESEKTEKKHIIDKINKELSKIDRSILELKDKYAILLSKKTELVKSFNTHTTISSGTNE